MRRLTSILVCVFVFPLTARAQAPEAIVREGASVVLSFNSPARAAAEDVLRKGGNAFDAVIAATFVEYVYAPGVTSISGPLTATFYSARDKKAYVLDGNYDAPVSPACNAFTDIKTRPAGCNVLVPGAPAALFLLHSRFGKLPWKELLAPAEQLARDGFVLDGSYSGLIGYRPEVLPATEYGRKTYFGADGTPLKPGDRIRFPEFADHLRRMANDGPEFMYRGDWAKQAAARIQSLGGSVTETDFAAYRARILEPRSVNAGGYTLLGMSGRNFGSLYSPLMLKVLERKFPSLGKAHYTTDGELFKKILRLNVYLSSMVGSLTPEFLDDEKQVAALFEPASLDAVWEIAESLKPGVPAPAGVLGTHSYHDIVADADGNVITLTNTINSLPWGTGQFVSGVPLNESAKFIAGTIGDVRGRLPSSMASHLLLKDGELAGAFGAFNMSLMQANFQFLLNVIFYGMPAKEAVSTPRFGAMAFDFKTGNFDVWTFNLREGFSPEAEKRATDEGFRFDKSLYADAGDGGAVLRNRTGWSGAFSPSFTAR